MGGMGEVYRATDTRLKRQVALKVLPAAFTSDPERIARFQREAEVLAALNHPNIAQIYGIEEAAGVTALVLELVDGPTLADRIAQEPIPIDEALPIAKQIAEALEAAHEQGIIHRDLKPANIKVRDDGTVKVLDFGLAKLAETATPSSNAALANSPTITSPAMMTGVGVLLGTAAYMSPEQAKGRPADKRSDIWAFGCVLYEMLTGKRAFGGEDVSETLAAILRADLDWSAVPSALPPLVRTALTESLQKNPRDRISDVAAIRFALLHAAAGPVGQRLESRPWLIGVAVVIAALVVATVWRRPLHPTVSPRLTVRSVLPLGSGEHFTGTNSHLVSLSHDGRRIAYVANDRLWLRELASLESTVIPGSEGFDIDSSREPFFSPDGEWLGFWQGARYKKVSVHGGAPIVICEAMSRANVGGASWDQSDAVLFGGRGVWRVPASGGKPEPIVSNLNGLARMPRLIGSEYVMFTLVPDGDEDHPNVVVQSLKSGERRILQASAADADVIGNRTLTYFSDGTVFAAPFDAAALKVTGPPVPLIQHVARGPFNPTAVSQYSVAQDGTFVYVPDSAMVTAPPQLFVFVDRHGHEAPLDLPARPYVYPRLSPDAARIAAHIQADSLDLWSIDLRTRRLTRLTSGSGREFYPVWLDNRHLLYGAGTPPNVWRLDVEGGGAPERVTTAPVDAQLPNSILPDGSALLVTLGAPSDIALVPLHGDSRSSTTLLHSAAAYRNAEISPDGRWLAYQTNGSGRFEIEVRSFPDVKAERHVVSNGGGTQPAWSRSGDQLFYVALAGGLMGIPVVKGSTWSAGLPQPIVTGAYTWSLPDITGRLYDIAPGGQFLLMKPERATEMTMQTMVLVQNALGPGGLLP
jgi:serine/threonine-protein kinase